MTLHWTQVWAFGKKCLSFSFPQMNVLLSPRSCSQWVCFCFFVFFSPPSQFWSNFPLSFHVPPQELTCFFHFLYEAANQRNHFLSLQIPECPFRSWPQPWQMPEPGNRETEAKWWLLRRAEPQLRFQLCVHKCDTAKSHQYMHIWVY